MPYVALQNAMMCKVHRQLKLGLIVDYDIERLSLDANIDLTPKDSPLTEPDSDGVQGSMVGEIEGSPTEVGTIHGGLSRVSRITALGDV